MWDVSGTKEHWQKADTDQVWCAVLSPDGETLATANRAGMIQLRDPATGEIQKSWSGRQGAIKCLAYSPDGRTLASGGDDKMIRLWTTKGELLLTLEGHGGPVNGLAFAPDSLTLASVSHDHTVRLWRGSSPADNVPAK